MIAKKNKAMQKAEFERLKKTVANSKVRLGELDKLMAKLYEDNVLGRVTDDFSNDDEKLRTGTKGTHKGCCRW